MGLIYKANPSWRNLSLQEGMQLLEKHLTDALPKPVEVEANETGKYADGVLLTEVELITTTVKRDRNNFMEAIGELDKIIHEQYSEEKYLYVMLGACELYTAPMDLFDNKVREYIDISEVRKSDGTYRHRRLNPKKRYWYQARDNWTMHITLYVAERSQK